MYDLKWTDSEKKLARRVFDEALESALARTLSDFKARAAAAETPSAMWVVGDYLHRSRRDIDETFNYRYSKLPLVFAMLIRKGHLDMARLSGLSEEKLEVIRRLLS